MKNVVSKPSFTRYCMKAGLGNGVCSLSSDLLFLIHIYRNIRVERSQVDVTSMGSPMSSTIANFVQEELETIVIASVDLDPHFKKRHVARLYFMYT